MSHSEDRALEVIKHAAAEFILREAGTESLITVTRAKSIGKGERVIVFVSVFPEDKARAALSFLERQREAFSDHLKTHVHMRIPRVDFLPENNEDVGEAPKI